MLACVQTRFSSILSKKKVRDPPTHQRNAPGRMPHCATHAYQHQHFSHSIVSSPPQSQIRLTKTSEFKKCRSSKHFCIQESANAGPAITLHTLRGAQIIANCICITAICTCITANCVLLQIAHYICLDYKLTLYTYHMTKPTLASSCSEILLSKPLQPHDLCIGVEASKFCTFGNPVNTDLSTAPRTLQIAYCIMPQIAHIELLKSELLLTSPIAQPNKHSCKLSPRG